MHDSGFVSVRRDAQRQQIEAFPLSQADALVELAEESALGPDSSSAVRQAAMGGVRFDRGTVCMRVEHPGGNAACKCAFVYRVNTQVLAALHRGYIHPGTPCQIELPTLNGDTMTLRASIAQCRHLSGLIHDSVLELADRLDLRQIVKWSPELASLIAESETPRVLRGRVLHIEPSASERALFEARLRATELQVTAVIGPAEAYDACKRTGNWHLIVSELRVGSTPLPELAGKLRALGEHAPLLILTSERGPQRQAIVEQAEASAVLEKPYTGESLLALMSSLLPELPPDAHRVCAMGRVCSSLKSDDEARPLVHGYIQECVSRVSELERSIAHDDVPACRAICLWLVGSARAFGFDVIAEQAGRALTEIDATGSTAEAARSLSVLTSMMRRMWVCGEGGCEGKAAA
ncbi:MAG: hypothetical protein Kow0022_01910 [Phycisphaerales bacterium]